MYLERAEVFILGEQQEVERGRICSDTVRMTSFFYFLFYLCQKIENGEHGGGVMNTFCLLKKYFKHKGHGSDRRVPACYSGALALHAHLKI